ncbi:MAG: ABC transporter permease [Vicinamibacterales bacterium]
MTRRLSRVLAMVRRWFDRGARDRTLDAELESFVEHEIDARMAEGLTPAEARRTALAAIGGLQQTREQARAARTGAALDALARDARYAARSVRRSPGLSLAVVGSLAVGIGVTVVGSAFTNAWLFRAYPGVTDQQRLVDLDLRRLPNGRPPGQRLNTVADYEALREGLSTVGDVAATTGQRIAVQLPDPHSVLGLLVSENYFDVLGTRAALGRTFRPDEAEPARAAVAVISHRLWRGALRADPEVVGRPIRAGGEVVRIVGVAPPDFGGTTVRLGFEGPDVWLPLALATRVAPDAATVLRPDGLSFIARLRPGADVAAVRAAAGAVAAERAVATASPSGAAPPPGAASVSAVSATDPSFLALRVFLVMTIPVLVLVVACVNAASLTLARGSRQRREVAIRLAIGAERGRIVRQLVIESTLLACLAAALALPLAWVVLRGVSGRLSLPMPIDAAVLGWAIVTTATCAVASGLLPAFRVTARAPLQALSVSRAATDSTPAESRGKRVLVVTQIAVSIGVLVAGTQLIALVEGQGATGGTPPDRLLMASFDLDQLRYPPDAADVFYRRVLDATSRLPDAEAVGLARPTSVWTFGRGKGPGSVIAWVPGREAEIVIGGYAGGDLFGAIGLPLLAGRPFTAADRTGPPRVAIVNSVYAESLPGRQAIGRAIRLATWRRQTGEEAQAEARDVTIVGVVSSAGERQYTMDGSPVGKIYVPSPLGAEPALTLYARSRGPAGDLAAAVRQAVGAIDPRVPIADMGSLATFNERAMGPSHWLTRMSALLGVIALLLAAAGLFAAASLVVTLRAREFAVRLALGATPRRVLTLVLAQALKTAAIGFLVGGTLALGVSRVIASQFHGATGIDVPALGWSSALLVAVMLVASAFPAMRAARVDPVEALKHG